MSALRLDDNQLDALADRIAAKLAVLQSDAGGDRDVHLTDSPAGLLSAEQLAARLGVSVGYVREHADELGVVRIGSGKKPRLRFPADAAIPTRPALEAKRPRPRRSSTPVKAGSVLAIRGGSHA